MTTTVFGINLEVVIVILLALILVLAILLILTIRKLSSIERKYYTLMSGKKGKDLERIVFTRFKEMDKVKSNAKRLNKEFKHVQNYLNTCYSKMGLVKYDAFDDLAGNLSFSLAILNHEDTGVVINAMHSKQGCFTYAKEIIKGESYIPLSEEEKEAIQKAITIDEEIQKMVDNTEDESFDVNDVILKHLRGDMEYEEE